MVNLEFFETAEQLTKTASALIVESLNDAVEQRGRFLIALSGGNTPRPVYERLAHAPYGNDVPWKDVQVFFGDERMVPSDNQESNFHMVCYALLDHIKIPPWNVHRIAGEVQPDVAARWYDRQLRDIAGGEGLPRFDLMLLGLGPDGHTASLFPGTDVLDNDTDFAAPVRLPDDSQGVRHAQERVTLTYPVINASRQIVFLVAGDDKADALDRIERGDESTPAARVKPTDGTIRWLVVKP